MARCQVDFTSPGMANSVDPDKTASSGAVRSGSALSVRTYLSLFL